MKEIDFEAHIEKMLTSPEGGLNKGCDTYDCATALYRDTLLRFVQETQPKAWKKYTRLVTRNPEEAFIKTFNERCTRDGLLRALCKWYAHIGQITRLNDLKLHKEYVFARYLIKVLPTKPGEIVDIEGKIEMEYYKLEETGNGSIQLAGTDGVLEPGTTTAGGGNVDKKEPLDELLNRINEDMGGNFTEANKVAARTIMAMLRENTSLAASARSSNMKVFMDTIFKGIFEHAAMDCYVKSMEGFEDLMKDDHKRNKLREKLAQELYRQFRSEYADVEEKVLMAAED